MSIADYSTTPASNSSINGINIAEGCAPANINDAIRQMMADLAELRNDLVSGAGAYAFLPIGAAVVWFDDNLPTNYRRADGAAISRTTHAALFAKWGTRYGAGDGSTTFNLPNFAGRALVGAGNGAGLTPRAVGATGGAENHQLTADQMPTHQHAGTTDANGSHTHDNGQGSGGFLAVGTGIPNELLYTGVGSSVYPYMRFAPHTGHAGSHGHSFTTDNRGGSQSHNNMQPFLAANIIVRVI